MTRPSKLLVIPILAAFQFGCDPEPEYSDLGQWEFDVSLSNDIPEIERPSRVLVGSRIGIELLRLRDDDGDYVGIPGELADCTHLFGDGSVQWIEVPDDGSNPHGLVTGAGPGKIVITAPHDACPDYQGRGEDFVRDEWSVVGVEPADVTGNWMAPGDVIALSYHQASGPTPYPDSLGRLESGGPVPIAAGGSFAMQVVLTQDNDGETVEVREGRDDEQLLLPSSWLETGIWSLEVGDQVDAGIVYDGTEITLPAFEGVDADRITTLELVPIYARDKSGERDWGLPSGVIAVTHDAEGRRIYGAPVEWSMTRGWLSFVPAYWASDILALEDSCRELPRHKDRRNATIEARLGDLVATADLEWTALRSDDNSITIDPNSDFCVKTSTCECSANARPSDSLLAVFGLLLLGAGFRRRRGVTTSTSPGMRER